MTDPNSAPSVLSDEQRLIDYFAEIQDCIVSIQGALRHRQQPQDFHFHKAEKACRDGAAFVQSRRSDPVRAELLEALKAFAALRNSGLLIEGDAAVSTVLDQADAAITRAEME